MTKNAFAKLSGAAAGLMFGVVALGVGATSAQAGLGIGARGKSGPASPPVEHNKNLQQKNLKQKGVVQKKGGVDKGGAQVKGRQ
ncbi:MAG: hypothetical protein AB7O88_19900 [Reyranellaceae bacterium]